MKILWITNVLFPDICEVIGIAPPVTGGWMKSSAQAILNLDNGVELAVASLYGNKFRKEVIKEVTYYCLPFDFYNIKYNASEEETWKKIAMDFKPDIIHIHGTEYPHGLAYIKANGVKNVVISIQGLVSIYARYALGQIPINILRKHRTLYDIFREHTLELPHKMEIQGQFENEYIKTAHHIMGRTNWDHDHIWAINPMATYHFCNETLREPFYEKQWHYDKCERHSIFLSQAHKPIKGIHKVIEALPYILRQYPDTKVYVAGNDFIHPKSLKEQLKFGTYAKYISYLMKKFNVQNNFIFTGVLNENQMAERYQSANVFICPSSIENSPNSVGEAQLIGVPVIASYVGGMADMIEHEQTGLLYRFEEHEMLAKCIYRIFEDVKLASVISQKERNVAAQRHSRTINAKCTLQIYNKIINQDSKTD
jgi:glycosyltransferase involved in cell wall biosynthesis